MTIVIILALAFGFMGSAQPAKAAGAIGLSWLVSVTYQNVGGAATTVNVDFYQEDSITPISFNPLAGVGDGTLAAGAGASFGIGSVSGVANGFKGNAIITTSEPVVATIVQFHQNASGETVNMRMLSNGFQSDDAAAQYLIATALMNKFSRTTIFSIQNTTDVDIVANVKLYDADNNGALANGAAGINHTIKAYSSKYIKMDDPALTGLDAGLASFNGSAIVTAATGTVVAAISELYTNRDVAANFEGVTSDLAANTIYMATGLCNNSGLDTFYAVQNASLTDNATITVEYYSKDGVKTATDVYQSGGNSNLGPGQKWSVNTCKPSDGTFMGAVPPSTNGFTGSAKITSVGAPLVVIGKAVCAAGACQARFADVFTAFMGEKSGSSILALPYVRWSTNERFNVTTPMGPQRSYLAIQNLEATTAVVDVKYYDKIGTLCGTETLTIPGNSKGQSNPSSAGVLGCPLGDGTMNPGEFGYYAGNKFGGSVLIKAADANPTAKFIAIARVNNPGAAEDYNAVPVDPVVP